MQEIHHPPSDESLRLAILAVFAADQYLAGTEIRVGVMNGIAHLVGKVNSQQTRARAEELAGHFSGIRGVVNRIEAPGAPDPAREINLDLNNQNSHLNER